MTVVPSSTWWSAETDEASGNGTCSFRTINKGIFTNDLPNKRASGKTFEFRGVIDVVIEGGLIKELNEWYSWNFDNSKEVAQYHSLADEDL
jgi:hypothetical protein